MVEAFGCCKALPGLRWERAGLGFAPEEAFLVQRIYLCLDVGLRPEDESACQVTRTAAEQCVGWQFAVIL